MNYVNIKGIRINLSTVTHYESRKANVILFFNVYSVEDQDLSFVSFAFQTEAEAQQCIDFLDKKTKCEAFKLAK